MSQALIYAPFEDSVQLAICFANRSAALYKLNEFDDALKQIALAVEYGYPADKLDKLIKRKQLCLDAIENRIEQEREQMSTFEEKLNQFNCNQSKLFGFTSNVDCYAINGYRGVRATSKLDRGDIVSVQQPYVSVLNRSNYELHCYNCFASLRNHTKFPCRQCTQVFYCNSNCEATSFDSVHKYECCYIDLINLCDNFFYPPMIALRTVLNTDKQVLKDTIRDRNQPVDHTTLNYGLVFDLVTHERDCSDYSLPAALMLSFLSQIGFVNDEELTTISKLLLRHIQQCQVNALRIFNDNNTIELGCGLFSTFSLINHSCRPNLSIKFRGTKLILIANRDIEPGEELFISYGVDETTSSRVARKQYLKNNYFFDCSCVACRE